MPLNKLGLPKRHPVLYILTLLLIPIAFFAIVDHVNASPDSEVYRAALITPGSSVYCDHWFNELWLQEVPPLIQAQCVRRFTFNVAQIKRSSIRNSK